MRTRLILFDPSSRPSLFDSGAAIDANVDLIESLGLVAVEEVPRLVQDALFSRKPGFHTAFWIGGSDHPTTDALAQEAFSCQVPPFHANVALDPSGAHTTAAAVVQLLHDSVQPSEGPVLVVGGTGMVGQAIVTMASWLGYSVWMGAPREERARQIARELQRRYEIPEPAFWPRTADVPFAAVISAGPPGLEVFRPDDLKAPPRLLIDINAVPPAGIRGVKMNDAGRQTDWGLAWGAYAVGQRKMALHHRLIQQLFQPPHRLYDRRAILAFALESSPAGHDAR
ncbi:MAG: hypothetical protein OWU84_10365 [Firmicutes bacterium]|nr:hypothetical protein [Bacillota bacterium]